MQRVYTLVNIGCSNYSQQFICCLKELSHEKRWHGKRLPIKFQLLDSKTQIRITTKLLSDEFVEGLFITRTINVNESNIEYKDVLSDDFNKLFLLCSFKDLLEKKIVRNIINDYRMKMNYQGRSKEVYLCLIDNDGLLLYNNEDNEEQLQIDFFQLLLAKKHDCFKISDKCKRELSEFELQDLGQYTIPIPNHHSDVVTICENLFVHLKTNKDSGYIELAQVIINDLLEPIGYKITKFSRNQNYNYMFNIMSLLKKLFSSTIAQANVAVVGTSSAGKTLLINDMMIAMKRMGYTAGPPQKYTPIGNLRFDIMNNEQTPNYAMRDTYIYDSMYTFGNQTRKNINFTFVNIPGEIFKAERLNICAQIYQAINNITSKAFTKRIIKTSGGRVVTFLEYHPVSREELNTSNDNHKTKNRFSYLSKADICSYHGIFQNNYDKTYARGKIANVSGKDVLKEYFLYDTDSIVNAIYDAWIDLIDEVTISRDVFFSDYSKDFSFHMYLHMATDMIICDKLINNDNGELTANIDPELGNMLSGIGTYCRMTPTNLNFYVAFRAADVAINNAEFQQINNELINQPAIMQHYGSEKIIRQSNALYSYFVYCMSRYTTPIANATYTVSNVLFGNHANLDITDINIINQLNDLCNHANDALTICDMHIPGIINNANTCLSSHVYYTATPIEESGRIYADTSEDRGVANFLGFTEGLSLCFGSMQLCIDILNRHRCFPYVNDGTYGIILSDIFR